MIEERDFVEIADPPFFIGVQFHPEFKSKPLAPQPLFDGFVNAARGLMRGEVPRRANGDSRPLEGVR